MLVLLPKADTDDLTVEDSPSEVGDGVGDEAEVRPRLTILRLFANLEDDLVEGITASVDDGTFSSCEAEEAVEATEAAELPRPL